MKRINYAAVSSVISVKLTLVHGLKPCRGWTQSAPSYIFSTRDEGQAYARREMLQYAVNARFGDSARRSTCVSVWYLTVLLMTFLFGAFSLVFPLMTIINTGTNGDLRHIFLCYFSCLS
jgi:hypothetical protein